jgi:late competence protein required for DNA uptake (superfamily II DNA/RNA helicase)
MVETLRHKEAFEYYYTLGDKRSITEVQRKYNVSRPAVAKWSIAFNWQERIQQRDIEVSKGLEKKTNNEIINDKANYVRIIREALKQFEENLNKKRVPLESSQDYERLVKLHLLLTGEATERDEVLNVTMNIKGV